MHISGAASGPRTWIPPALFLDSRKPRAEGRARVACQRYRTQVKFLIGLQQCDFHSVSRLPTCANFRRQWRTKSQGFWEPIQTSVALFSASRLSLVCRFLQQLHKARIDLVRLCFAAPSCAHLLTTQFVVINPLFLASSLCAFPTTGLGCFTLVVSCVASVQVSERCVEAAPHDKHSDSKRDASGVNSACSFVSFTSDLKGPSQSDGVAGWAHTRCVMPCVPEHATQWAWSDASLIDRTSHQVERAARDPKRSNCNEN